MKTAIISKSILVILLNLSLSVQSSIGQNQGRIYLNSNSIADTVSFLKVPPANTVFASTFLGGDAEYENFKGAAVAIDNENNIIVAGHTKSADHPVTKGVITEIHQGDKDIFITKFDKQLKKIIASTFVGGTSVDLNPQLAVDQDGNIFVSGASKSKEFVSSMNILYEQNQTDSIFIFIMKLSNDISTIINSAVLSSESSMRSGISEISFDGKSNHLILGGMTTSAGFPISSNAFQDTLAGGGSDKFLTIIDSELKNIIASTYFGGDSPDGFINGLEIDSQDNIIVGGSTFSKDFPVTNSSYKSIPDDGMIRGHVTKFNSDLTEIIASTFIGETGNDFVYGIKLDKNENVVFTGHLSDEMRATPGTFNSVNNGHPDVCNLGILSNDLTTLIAHTYIVGGGEGSWYGGFSYSGPLAVDSHGNIYVMGTTDNSYFPTTPDSFDDTHNGKRDVFVSKFNDDLSVLLYSTLIGGNSRDLTGDLILDNDENIIIVGSTMSDNFPCSAGSYDNSLDSVQAVYISKFHNGLFEIEEFPAHKTAKQGEYLSLKKIIDDEAVWANGRDQYHRTPLHWAARYNHVDIINYLLEIKSDINSIDNDGNTPLHIAALRNNFNAAQYLLKNGAELNVKNHEGNTPLHLASFAGNTKIINLLADHNCDLNLKNNDGNTSLHRGAHSRLPIVVELLLQKGADPDIQNKNGETPLHLACITYKSEESVHLLVEHGADINLITNDNYSPLHYAANYGWQQNGIELLKAKPKLDVVNNVGQTPLHLAVENGLEKLVQDLVEMGADFNIKDNEGKSARDIAVENEMTEIQKILDK